MKKSILVLLILLASNIFAETLLTNRHVLYITSSKTIRFSGGDWDNRFILPIEGDFRNYKALHIDCKNVSATFRIKFEYNDIDGELCHKTFYQTISSPKSCTKTITLADNPDFLYCGQIIHVQINMIKGGNYMVLNGIYLEDLDKNKREIILE